MPKCEEGRKRAKIQVAFLPISETTEFFKNFVVLFMENRKFCDHKNPKKSLKTETKILLPLWITISG